MATVTYPSRIRLANLPTPLEPLDRLSEEIGGPRLWLKRDDLTGSALSGNKIRKLEFSLAEARDLGADTVITCGGLQSNHCRATAIAGARIGLRVHLVLRGVPEGAPQGNHFLDHIAGATVSTYPVEEYRSRLDEIFADLVSEYAAQGRRAHTIPLGASDETGMWGYIAATEELVADFARLDLLPTHIVCADGSGGTHAGLVVGKALFEHGAEVSGICVCDSEEYFVTKIRADMRLWREKFGHDVDVDTLPVRVIDGHKGPGYAKSTPEIRETIRRVGRVEGVILDPVYTGKAFHGLLQEIEAGSYGSGGDIVFIHTGGIYGLLAQTETFENEMEKIRPRG